ncbi:MAG: rolling circle replication-associated protein [Phycisphaerales bacterium]
MALSVPSDPDPGATRTGDHERPPAAAGDASDSEAAAAGGAASLEYFQNVVTGPPGRQVGLMEVAKCGCDCWFCPDCCTRKGYTLRAGLVPILETFTGLMMLTLTIDPELFPSPYRAYLYLRERRAISVLIQGLHRGGHLHSRRYISVVEFQKQTEQPHFHVLVDATRIPKAAIDAEWSKNRPRTAPPVASNRPAFGMTRFSRREFEGGPIHAARYVTKYLVKTPEHGYPGWALEMGAGKRLPRYSTSRGFWGREPRASRPVRSKREAKQRTYRERLAECGTSCNVFKHSFERHDGSGEVRPRRRWLSRVALDAALLERVPGLGTPSPRRRLLVARSVREAIEILQRASGASVSVMAGVGAGVRRASIPCPEGGLAR